MRRKILPFILGGALSIAAVAPAAAAHTPALGQPTLAGLVNVFVQVENVLNNSELELVTVDINDSFNNILRNADINVLNDLLRNADIDITITDIQVVRGDVIITLLGGDVVVLR